MFESGLGASCLSWSRIQPELAGSAATYSYDRAGFGWSANADRAPCSLETLAEDLHSWVEKKVQSRPFVLVAHSFGAYIARLYVKSYPQDVAAVVLVDPLTPEEWTNPTAAQRRRLRHAIFFTRSAGVLAFLGIVRFGLGLLFLRKTPGPLSRRIEILHRIGAGLGKFPPECAPIIRANWSRPRFFFNMAENLRALPACAPVAARCPFPAGLPVTVISSSIQSPEVVAYQRTMGTRHVLATRSGHFIQLDEPQLVVREVLAALDNVKPKSFTDSRPQAPSSQLAP